MIYVKSFCQVLDVQQTSQTLTSNDSSEYIAKPHKTPVLNVTQEKTEEKGLETTVLDVQQNPEGSILMLVLNVQQTPQGLKALPVNTHQAPPRLNLRKHTRTNTHSHLHRSDPLSLAWWGAMRCWQCW